MYKRQSPITSDSCMPVGRIFSYEKIARGSKDCRPQQGDHAIGSLVPM